jgi:hypothetical protein
VGAAGGGVDAERNARRDGDAVARGGCEAHALKRKDRERVDVCISTAREQDGIFDVPLGVDGDLEHDGDSLVEMDRFGQGGLLGFDQRGGRQGLGPRAHGCRVEARGEQHAQERHEGFAGGFELHRA